jgi:acetolactate synthase-1/2/3 large subunit
MGYGLPAAVAAKIRYPERQVVCFAGDGCFLMHGQEFSTAVMYKAALIVLVINNSMFGACVMWLAFQRHTHPDNTTHLTSQV